MVRAAKAVLTFLGDQMRIVAHFGVIVVIALALLGPVSAEPTNIYGIHFWAGGASGIMTGHQGYDVECLWPGVKGITDWSTIRNTVKNAKNDGFTPIVRLCWDDSTKQTVPSPNNWADRAAFASQCKACVAAIGDLCNIWVIGNEMNMGSSGAIPAEWYMTCFNGFDENCCYTQIHSQQKNAIVLMGPVAPWNADTNAPGPYDNTYERWKNYWHYLVSHAGPSVDGWAVHAYGGRTNGQPGNSKYDPDARDDCNAPYKVSDPKIDVAWDFNCFRYFVDEVATAQGDLNRPIFITETNCACDTPPSISYQTGYMQSTYEAVDTYNKNHYQKIRSMEWFVYDPAGGWVTYALCCASGNMAQAKTDYQSMTSAENYKWTSDTPDAYIYKIDVAASDPKSKDPNKIVLGSYVGKREGWRGDGR